MFGAQNIHPIIFEECYVKDDDDRFVQIVKNSADLTEQKLMMMDPNAFDQ
jgi:16S rRNA U1498 N3-methylase RsmE